MWFPHNPLQKTNKNAYPFPDADQIAEMKNSTSNKQNAHTTHTTSKTNRRQTSYPTQALNYNASNQSKWGHALLFPLTSYSLNLWPESAQTTPSISVLLSAWSDRIVLSKKVAEMVTTTVCLNMFVIHSREQGLTTKIFAGETRNQ